MCNSELFQPPLNVKLASFAKKHFAHSSFLAKFHHRSKQVRINKEYPIPNRKKFRSDPPNPFAPTLLKNRNGQMS